MNRENAEPTHAADADDDTGDIQHRDAATDNDQPVPEKQIHRWKDDGGAWLASN
ncbi:hypothetical protein [Cumulibacter soli]|uniref:hypothetical protein n=1 Tax=Cumulibacter soli TaxID=2546344 RepID=UPI00141A3001|nr:hypothetical protein [Cumulibacter soli]